MNLNVEEWKEFRLADLIDDIYKAKAHTKDEVEELDFSSLNGLNFVSRTENTNGIDTKVANNDFQDIENGNCLIIGDTTSTIFYQKDPFIAGDHIVVIRSNWMNEERCLFIKTILEKERYRYSYGRAFKTDLIKSTLIKLPAILVGYKYEPDWIFMENFIRSLYCKRITTRNHNSNLHKIHTNNWQEFKVGDIFDNPGVEKHSAIPEDEGNIPFVSSTSTNNGIAKYVDEDSIPGNCITVSTNGDCFDAFYQPDSIAVSTDVDVLTNNNLNQYNALFVCSVLKLEKPKWCYGRKPKNNKVYETIIKLPAKIIDNKYEPDWKYMENYIKSLPYGDRI